MAQIRIRWQKSRVEAKLNDTPTARKLLEKLPVRAVANTWGKEVYFKVPVEAPLEPNAQQVVNPGTVCFWVEGQSLALPFGPTPISEKEECRLVTRVNLLGRITGDPQVLSSVREGDRIFVERI